MWKLNVQHNEIDINFPERLFKKFSESGELRERLLLNHFIVLNNVFGSDAAITLLLFKIEKEHWGIMKSFLIYLNMLEKHELSDVRADEHVLDVLRKI